MADIIDFKSRNSTMTKETGSFVKEILQEILKDSDNIVELIILVKDKDNNKYMMHTDASIEDKSVFIQLIQHDIFNDLMPTEEVHFEPDV